MHLKRTIAPPLTLADIHGSGFIYTARFPPRTSDWLPSDPSYRDAATGAQLAIAGQMPILVHAGAVTASGLDLLREAGHAALPERLHAYRHDQEAVAMLQDLVASGLRAVVQHRSPTDEFGPESWWVSPDLLAFLNNKAELGALVPAEWVPPRMLLSPRDLLSEPASTRLPCVVKAATAHSSGGGADVLVCRNTTDLTRAAAAFARCEAIILEDLLSMERNLCLSFAVLPDGEVRHLGTAEQVSLADGRYDGNWLGDVPANGTAREVGHAVVARAAELGWRGCAGIDIALLRDGRLAVFDLNFRVAGSTPPVMLLEGAVRALGRNASETVARSRTWLGSGTFGHLLAAARTLLERGWLVPLATFDPTLAGRPADPPRLMGLLLGSSRDEVTDRMRELSGLGLR